MAGSIELSPRIVRVNGETSSLISIGALVGFAGVWRAGGVAAFLLDGVGLGLPAPREAFELHLVYWGFRLDRMIASGTVELNGGLLLGAGTAELHDSATGVRSRSDNFLLLEPTLSITRPIHRFVTIGTIAGYRATFGVDGLESVGADDLSGWSLGISLRLGPF